MDNFIVSARKYRPATFRSVVGQGSITTTLKNAIKTNHLAHAYLFCGPRGVGKTTCARIFAKTINCKNLTDDFEACNVCESCAAFNSSRSYNIHELDAASNNSVEDIRNLTDQVRIPPQIGTHSVYIIDEVHMLSSAAFNAFLKTLEEPPSHANFILATTEKHKILPTILSRCQIFDFNRIKVEDIVGHLEYVAISEDIIAEAEGLHVIAQKADGGMRDALSYFDQIVSFSGSNITYSDVIENLNVLDYEYYFKLTDAFHAMDYSTALLMFDTILAKGFDGHHFITGISAHFRDLLVCRDEETLVLLEVGAGIRKRYLEQAQKCDERFLLKALTIANESDIQYNISRNPRLHVELALLKMCDIMRAPVAVAAPVVAAKKDEKQVSSQDSPKVKKVTQQKTTTPSIREIINGASAKKAEKKTEEIVKETEKATVFTREKMVEIWLEYAKKMSKTRPRLSSAMESQIPVLKENFVVEMTLNNKLQEDAFVQVRNEILFHLKKRLENDSIQFVTKIAKAPKKKHVYTAEEKFEYLKGKNPTLLKLKEDFQLDFA